MFVRESLSWANYLFHLNCRKNFKTCVGEVE